MAYNIFQTTGGIFIGNFRVLYRRCSAFGLIMENDAQSLFNKSLITVENPLETSPRSLSIVRTKNQVPPSLDYWHNPQKVWLPRSPKLKTGPRSAGQSISAPRKNIILYQRLTFCSWFQCIKVNGSCEHMVVAVKIPKPVAGYAARPIDLHGKAAYGTLCIVDQPIDFLAATWSTFCPPHSWPHFSLKITACSNLQRESPYW